MDVHFSRGRAQKHGGQVPPGHLLPWQVRGTRCYLHSAVADQASAVRRNRRDARPARMRKFLQCLESAGHLAVMAIFSRDGFVRFIRLDHSQEIELYGNGVEKHESGIWGLTSLD